MPTCVWKRSVGMTLLLAVVGCGQVTPGRVMGHQRVNGGVLFQMKSGALRLEVCTPSMLHVVYSPDGAFPKHPNPMIVRTEWPAVPFELAEDGRRVTLSTGKVRVSIARRDGAIQFTDASGARLFHAEGDYGGVRLTPAVVNGERTYRLETVFFPESGEAFYGLGQHQAGVWNYSGESVDLSQDNTNISVPFFLSSLGYGVFWNNPSQSRFNNRFARHLYIDSDVADTLDYYFLYGPDPDRIIAAYRDLTGPAPLFGKWAYGLLAMQEPLQDVGGDGECRPQVPAARDPGRQHRSGLALVDPHGIVCIQQELPGPEGHGGSAAQAEFPRHDLRLADVSDRLRALRTLQTTGMEHRRIRVGHAGRSGLRSFPQQRPASTIGS